MSIRLQLLVIALTTLILPWAGCQYARELETTLRVAQESSLLSAADTIANALSAQPQKVFGDEDHAEEFSAAQGDLYLFPLHNEPLLDGYREDWNLAVNPRPLADHGLAARLIAGATLHFIFLYLEVDSPRFVPEPGNVRLEQDRFDRVDVTLQRPDGSFESLFFSTPAPGLIEAQTTVKGDDGMEHAAPDVTVQAYWRQTERGYHLEVRIPRRLIGTRLWLEAHTGTGPGWAGFMGAESLRGGRLYGPTEGLSDLLATFIRTGTRATVIDTNALKLAETGTLESGRDAESTAAEGSWYRRFTAGDRSRWPIQDSTVDRLEGRSVTMALDGRPAAEWLRASSRQMPLLSAAAPIRIDGRMRGAVVLEQSGDQLLELRDHALARLLNLTLLATALAAMLAFGVAARINRRIGRLGTAADEAVGKDGRIRLDMPESASVDEIGDLARAFERLLSRLAEHTHYLRTLGGKLSHELRTPVTIVRSSLDNLESEGLRPDQLNYITRARMGIGRLQSILSALGAASRVEESIKHAERVRFDLSALLESTAAAYRDSFPAARIELEKPAEACFIHGAPDLIVQLLDKLIDNAVDFCPPRGVITLRLTPHGNEYTLSVGNDGPPIAPEVLERLFEPLFEQRSGREDKPHFGLGLYIVRLVAEFHGGRTNASNRVTPPGVEFTITLPII